MSEDKNIRVIEINGIKMEIDLRTAKRIDNLKVGDRVKVLIKEYSSYKVFPGTIIGFEPFEKLPTIIIAYMETTYSSASVKFLYYNAKTEDTEVVRAQDDDMLGLEKDRIIHCFNKDIETKRNEVVELERKKAYFLKNFQMYWKDVEGVLEKMEAEFPAVQPPFSPEDGIDF
jgi:translation elongation factor EF-1alpha